MFWQYWQNNSRGNYIVNHEKGISAQVWVEADNHELANAKAEEIGLYFDGCLIGEDCPCCGDRWSRVEQYHYYVAPPKDVQGYYRDIHDGPEGYLHMSSGDIIPLHWNRGGYHSPPLE